MHETNIAVCTAAPSLGWPVTARASFCCEDGFWGMPLRIDGPVVVAHPASRLRPRAVAASRVVWHLARNPRVAMHLMRCNMVPILFQGLAKPDLSDPLPLIGESAVLPGYDFRTRLLPDNVDLMHATHVLRHAPEGCGPLSQRLLPSKVHVVPCN